MLTVEDAAKAAQVSPKTIMRLIEAGRLKAVNYATGKQRAKWRIDPAELSRVLPPEMPPADEPPVRVRRYRRRPVGRPDLSILPPA